jgi:hypothetical protein
MTVTLLLVVGQGVSTAMDTLFRRSSGGVVDYRHPSVSVTVWCCFVRAERLSGRADEMARLLGRPGGVLGHQLRTHRLDRLAGLFFTVPFGLLTASRPDSYPQVTARNESDRDVINLQVIGHCAW